MEYHSALAMIRLLLDSQGGRGLMYRASVLKFVGSITMQSPIRFSRVIYHVLKDGVCATLPQMVLLTEQESFNNSF
uniref:Uncharacterized protein n=1 Tax=Arundo donax TaxID=35708 RepID=A0A0A9DSB2_ARUDO